MVLASFDPPGNLDDYNNILNQLEAWSEYINEVFTSAVWNGLWNTTKKVIKLKE